jgi:hypothetical protein
MTNRSATAGRLALLGALVVLAFATIAYAGGVAQTASFGPASADQYEPRKVTICHHTRGKKGTKHVTISVSRNALRAHQRHGDTVGTCSTARSQRVHKGKAHAKKFHKSAPAAKGKAKGGKGKGKRR